MVTRFKVFEKIDAELYNAVYYFIPYSNMKLIRLVFERYKYTLEITDDHINSVMDNLSREEYSEIIYLYVFVTKKGFEGFWTIPADNKEKSEEELNKFIVTNSMVHRGKLELKPYEVDAIKYNL